MQGAVTVAAMAEHLDTQDDRLAAGFAHQVGNVHFVRRPGNHPRRPAIDQDADARASKLGHADDQPLAFSQLRPDSPPIADRAAVEGQSLARPVAESQRRRDFRHRHVGAAGFGPEVTQQVGHLQPGVKLAVIADHRQPVGAQTDHRRVERHLPQAAIDPPAALGVGADRLTIELDGECLRLFDCQM